MVGGAAALQQHVGLAGQAAQAFGTDHTEFQVTPDDFQLVEKLVWHHDGPFGDSSAIPTYVVSRPSADVIANGLRRVLTDKLAYDLTRRKNVALQQFFYGRTRKQPEKVKAQLIGLVS